MVEIEVSNATGQNRVEAYRMPGDVSRIFHVSIAPYAINQKIRFESEAHLKEFKKQKASLLTGKNPVLIIGHQLGKRKVEHAGEAVQKEFKSKVDKDLDKLKEDLGEAGEKTSGKPITIDAVRVKRKST